MTHDTLPSVAVEIFCLRRFAVAREFPLAMQARHVTFCTFNTSGEKKLILIMTRLEMDYRYLFRKKNETQLIKLN